jgi:hypothetical protein
MTCPECLAPLVVGGVLNVIMPAREAGEMFKECPKIDFIEPPPGSEERLKEFNEFTTNNLKKVTANDLQVPVRDDTPQAHMDGDKLNIVDPKNFKFICDVCGKECKNQFGLNSHKKSHKGGKR